MNLPDFLVDRPPLEAQNLVEATAITVLNAFVQEELFPSTELEYGYEDLPLLTSLATLLRDEARAWHQRRGSATDFRVLQRGFVHAFRAGLDLAAQLHLREGDGLVLPAGLDGVLDGTKRSPVRPPLQEIAEPMSLLATDIFVVFQNQTLAIAASAKNELLLDDFFACGCLWAGLAGVEAGLTRLDAPVAA
jgi:hypothetical protein